VFHNVKIVGNRNMPLCLAEFKNLSASNAIVYINPKTIINLVGIAKPIKKTNPPCLKTKKGKLCLHVFKYSNCHGDH